MERLEKFRTLLKDCEADGILLTSAVSRRYASCSDISEGAALITSGESFYFTDSRYIESAQKQMPDFTVKLTDREHPVAALLSEQILRLGLKNLGFEDGTMTVAEHRKLSSSLSVPFTPMSEKIDALRMVKDPDELQQIRRAQEITDEAFSDVLQIIHAGMTEKALRAELIYLLLKHGGEDVSFDPIVVSGPNSSMPHGVAGERTLQPGDFVTLDFGCRVKGYCSDMTRTVAIGFATEKMRTVYDTVLRAQSAAIAATRPGVTGKNIDGVARAVIEEAGFGAYFGHGYGHGVGLEIHESPNCSPSWEKPLPCGCVCSAEPGIYLPGEFGVRIEDLVVLTDSGCKNLTKSAKNLIIV